MVHSALGFTIKSGWAAAVVLGGSAAAPEVLDSRRIELSDPSRPEARQPYHAAVGTARKAGTQLDKLVAAVAEFGGRSVDAFIREQTKAGRRISGAALIVGSLIDPAQIANDHIRIHALEGQLFRGIVKDATLRHAVASSVWRERDLYELATTCLKISDSDLRQKVNGLGRHLSGGWRAEQKAATLAAWLVIAGAADWRRTGEEHLQVESRLL